MFDPNQIPPMSGQMQTTSLPPMGQAQQRWQQFFTQQGRPMPQIQRPAMTPTQNQPPQNQPPTADQFFNRLAQRPAPTGGLGLLWRYARERRPQGTQEVSRQPVAPPSMPQPQRFAGGFFRRGDRGLVRK